MHKEQYGCTAPVHQPYPYRNDPPVGLCPFQAFRDDPTIEYHSFNLHRHWSQGILPDKGALEDQAANYSTVILATDTGISVGQTALEEIAQRKADLQNRKK